MQTPLFPDNRVSERIEQLATKFGLTIFKITHTSSKDLGHPRQDSLDEEWQWKLVKSGCNISIGISFYYPSLMSNVIFVNAESGNRCDHFLLEKYLSSYFKNSDDYNQVQQVIKDRSWKENWSVELDLLDKHLEQDLGKIANGEEWPDIYFDWADYVEPAALDRIYQDQKDILDQEVPGKPRNAWVYFLDYFRKK